MTHDSQYFDIDPILRPLFSIPGAVVQGQHRAGPDGHDPDGEPGQPPHPHPLLHPLRHGLWQLQLRR